MATPPVFSFIIPTRGNPESLPRLFDSIRTHTHRPDEIEIVLVIDTDDEASRAVHYPGLNIRKVEGPPRRSMGALNTAGYRAATGQYMALLNDDVILRTPSWDDHVLDVFRSYPDGVVLAHVNDTIFRDMLCTFPFLTRSFCELAGGICDESYLRYRIDDHIHNVFDLLTGLGYRRRVYLPDVVFEHLNLTRTEKGYAYIVDPGIHATDTRRFDALFPERKRLALAAAESIDRHARSQNRRVREAKLEAVPPSNDFPDPAHARWRHTAPPSYGNPRVTVAVLSADVRSGQAGRCIEQIKTCTAGYDLVIVDHHRGPAFNRAREVNRLLEFCRADYLVLMDDCVLVEAGWLEGLMRAMGPQVGVVTPLHVVTPLQEDQTGTISYSGIVMQPDDSGSYSAVLGIGSQPRHIQTVSGAMMLIDINRCGHVRMDEVFSAYFQDIDYGLRIWEEGCRVVCTPWTQVTHIGVAAQSGDLFEADRRRWRCAWAETGRMRALRRGIWRVIAEFAEIPDQPIDPDQPLPEPLSSEPLTHGVAAAVSRLGRTLPYLNSLRPRILIGRGANLFDPDYYRTTYPDVSARGANPLLHFLISGAFEGRNPHPLFDTAFYLQSYPDVAAAKVNPLGHYLKYGARECRQPHPLFDSAYYLERYPDVRQSRMNPLVHYVLYGAAEGRQPHVWFQPDYYLDHCRERQRAAGNPLLHFLQADAKQRGAPHPQFDCEYYLRQNPGVAAAGMNPLVHYVLFGARAGRRPCAAFSQSEPRPLGLESKGQS